MASLRAERERAAALLRRGRWQIGAAVGVVLVAIAGLLVLAGGRPIPPGRSAYDAGTTDPVAALLPELAGYTEQARGLPFRTAPAVRVADAATLARAAADDAAGNGGAATGNRAATERALAFTGQPPATTPVAVYSPRERVVYLRRGQPMDPTARVALVHALTRALQAQNFDLATLARQTADDADQARALAALVEGDATRIELGYLGTLPAADQAAVRTRRDPAPTTYAQLAAAFPGTVGREFVTALAQQGGNPAVDSAFHQPPEATAQVIDPRAFLDGVGPLGVRPPPGEGQRVDAGTLGEFGLAALITGGRRAVNVGSAGRWLGDSYGTFRTATGLCTYVNIVLADSDAREQMMRDLARFVGARGGKAEATRSADRGIRLRSCA